MSATPFTTFLFGGLSQIAAQFPQVKLRYAYNEAIETHIVELTPRSEWERNAALDDAWMALALECYEQCPYEAIAFVSDDALVAVGQAEMEWNAAPARDPMLAWYESLIAPLAAYQPEALYSFSYRSPLRKTVSLPRIRLVAEPRAALTDNCGEERYGMAA